MLCAHDLGYSLIDVSNPLADVPSFLYLSIPAPVNPSPWTFPVLCSNRGVQSDPEGALWRDPPHYWEQIVWPAYVKAHSAMLDGDDMDRARPSGKVKDLVLIEGLEQSMGETIEVVCEKLVEQV